MVGVWCALGEEVDGGEKSNAAYLDIIAWVARRRRSMAGAPPVLEPRAVSAEGPDIGLAVDERSRLDGVDAGGRIDPVVDGLR